MALPKASDMLGYLSESVDINIGESIALVEKANLNQYKSEFKQKEQSELQRGNKQRRRLNALIHELLHANKDTNIDKIKQEMKGDFEYTDKEISDLIKNWGKDKVVEKITNYSERLPKGREVVGKDAYAGKIEGVVVDHDDKGMVFVKHTKGSGVHGSGRHWWKGNSLKLKESNLNEFKFKKGDYVEGIGGVDGGKVGHIVYIGSPYSNSGKATVKVKAANGTEWETPESNLTIINTGDRPSPWADKHKEMHDSVIESKLVKGDKVKSDKTNQVGVIQDVSAEGELSVEWDDPKQVISIPVEKQGDYLLVKIDDKELKNPEDKQAKEDKVKESVSKQVAVMNLKEMRLVEEEDYRVKPFGEKEAEDYIEDELGGEGEVVDDYFDEVEPSDEELGDLEAEELDEPDTENDVFYQGRGSLSSFGDFWYLGKKIASTEDELKAWMKKEQYYPTVWNVSDHGNVSLYTLEEAKVSEVLGYSLPDSDKRLIRSFLNKEQDPKDGKNLFIDDGNISSGWSKDLTTWVGDNKIKIGPASGNVSQTFVNAIKREAKAQGIQIEESKVVEADQQDVRKLDQSLAGIRGSLEHALQAAKDAAGKANVMGVAEIEKSLKNDFIPNLEKQIAFVDGASSAHTDNKYGVNDVDTDADFGEEVGVGVEDNLGDTENEVMPEEEPIVGEKPVNLGADVSKEEKVKVPQEVA